MWRIQGKSTKQALSTRRTVKIRWQLQCSVSRFAGLVSNNCYWMQSWWDADVQLSRYPAGTAPTQQARAGANCIKPREGRTSNTWTPETRWSVRHEVPEITQFGSALGFLWFAYELYPCVLGWNVTAVSAPCVTVLCKSTTHLHLTVPRSSLDHCYSPRPPPLISANFAGALQLLLQHFTIGPLIAGWWPPDGSIYR